MTNEVTTANCGKREPSSTPRFPMGQLLATPGSLRAMAELGVWPQTLLARHARGDWGDMCADDRAANELALTHGNRLMSSYRLQAPGTAAEITIWVITEWDRSVTTILLPEEY